MPYKPVLKVDSSHYDTVLGSLESKIMRVLWDAARRLALRPIVARVAQDFGQRDVNTIMTTLNRMVDKELLVRRGEPRDYTWEPCYTEVEFRILVAQQVLATVHEFVGDSVFDQVVQEVRAK